MSKRYYIYEIDIASVSMLALGIMFILEYFVMKLDWMATADYVLLLICMIPYSILHEIFHAVGYMLMGVKAENICFGILIEKGYLYCQSIQEVDKKTALVSLIMPFLFLGVVTGCIGLYVHNALLSLLSLYNIVGSISDLLLFFQFLRIEDFRFAEFDASRFYLFTHQAMTTKNLKSVNLLDIRDSVERKPQRRFVISRMSLFLLLAYCVACIYYFSSVKSG